MKLEILDYPSELLPLNVKKFMSPIYKLVSIIKENKYETIVELGCWLGHTTIALASLDVVKRIYTVDNFLGTNTVNLRLISEYPFENKFLSNIVYSGLVNKVVPIKGDSAEVGKIFQMLGINVDLVYVDACHLYECVVNDIESWLPNTKFICGDDYINRNYAVKKGVLECAKKFNKTIKSKGQFWWYE